MRIENINARDAKKGMKLAEDVYIKGTSGEILAAPEGTVLDEKLLAVLSRHNISAIKIFAGALQMKRGNLSPPPEKFVLPKVIVDDKLKKEATDSVKQLFTCIQKSVAAGRTVNKTTAYRNVENLECVVNDLLDAITGDTTGLIHINDLKKYDEYTYHHSLSVSVLSIAVGREMGLDSNTLFRLGRCAMMHDIGKQLIPLEIINKKGKLTDEEFEMIKQHTVLGANTLKSSEIGDKELWGGVMFHHEKMDGRGYPCGLTGDKIPLFAKIISVADVYDAVTSYRSYRSPMLPCKACNIITGDVDTAFDPEVVNAFFATLDVYPVNTVVELSDGRLGIVCGCKGASRLRPVVRIWGKTERVNLASQYIGNITIARVVPPDDLPAGYEFA